MLESLQGRGVPGKFVISQRSGNVTSCRLEGTNWLPCSYVHRQLIPGLRTCHSKCTGAKVCDREGDNKVATSVATSGGWESLSATDGCDWSTEVGDVWRCQSMQRLVCQQTQLELDALWDGKPMKAVLTLGNHRTQKNHKFRSKQHIVLWINNVKQYFIYT